MTKQRKRPDTQVLDRPIHEENGLDQSGDALDLTFGVVGSGGDGVITAGEVVEGALSNQGLHCFMIKSFGPQIRGGESYVQVRTSALPLATEGDELDLLIVLSWKDYRLFDAEIKLKKNAIVLHDPADKTQKDVELPFGDGKTPTAVEVPFAQLAKDSGNLRNKNMVMLGVLSSTANISRDGLEAKIKGRFGKKGAEVTDSMLAAFATGFDYAEKNLDKHAARPFFSERKAPMCVMTGNDAVAFGALYAGCRFFAGYPITPSTEIMEFMSRYLPRYGGRCIEVEDEIAAIGMCIGASFAGVKSMTGTSGPGLSLMTEMLGLASIAELPIVIANVQRVGPSTGIPTKSEQSDLFHSAYGGHGDASRVVIAPCDVEDCFDVTVKAFFIAERYQLPVIILSDQMIGQRKESIDPGNVIDELEGFIQRNVRKQPEKLEGKFMRFADTDDDVPVIAVPGTPDAMYQISGLEHTESGRPTSSYAYHERMAKRRARKLERVSREFRFLRWIGPRSADVGILAWGSSKGVVKDAVNQANQNGIRVAALIPQIVYPVPAEQIAEFIAAMKRIVVVELSMNAQFFHVINSAVNLPEDTISYARPGGNALRVSEVLDLINEALDPERHRPALRQGGAA